MSGGRLVGKVVIVTGASRGIGRAITRAYALEGARVAAVARTEGALEDLAVELGAHRVLPMVADVTSRTQVEAMVARVLEAWERVDVLVNNAGIGAYAPVDELAEEDWDRMMAVNLKGPFLCSRAVIPHMKERRAGHIIHISSIAGTTTFAGGGGYCASKWGLMALYHTLVQELKPYQIKVSALCPGSVQTEFGGTLSRSYSLRPEDVAQVALDVAAAPPGVILNTVEMRPLVPPEFQK